MLIDVVERSIVVVVVVRMLLALSGRGRRRTLRLDEWRVEEHSQAMKNWLKERKEKG
jgi:hypothetical protein